MIMSIQGAEGIFYAFQTTFYSWKNVPRVEGRKVGIERNARVR